MSDARPIFPVLNDGSGGGIGITKVDEGDTAAGNNSIPALVAKDPSGNLIFIKTNANGEIITSNEGIALTCLNDSGLLVGSTTEGDIASITLTTAKDYKEIGFVVSCMKAAEFRIVHLDDVTPNELATILVGPGDYTDSEQLDCLKFTSGASGVQILKIVGSNLFTGLLSDLRATLTVGEVN